MTDSISIYEKYNIDLSRLSRDYLKFPLRNREYPTKEDIEYLYLELNLSQSDLQKIFSINEQKLLKILKIHNIKKPQQLRVLLQENTVLQKYGVSNVMKKKEIKQRAIETYKNKTGYDNPSQNPEVKKKKIETSLKNFGVEYALKLPEYKKRISEKNKITQNLSEVKEKIKQTNIKNHNGVHSNNCEEVKKKKAETCLKHFGTTSHMKNEEFKNDYLERQLKNKGYRCTFQDPKTKEKSKNFYKINYGCDVISQVHIAHFEDLNEDYFRNNFIRDNRFLINECAEYFNAHKSTIGVYKEKFNINEPNQSRKCQQENLWLDLLNITNRRHKIYINKKTISTRWL